MFGIVKMLKFFSNINIMLDLEKLKSSEYFTEISLQSGEILFREGDLDEHLYIVYDGELSVERSVSSSPWNFKTLWLLWIWNIVGESALTRNEEKEVQIKAHRATTLLSIHWKEDFPNFVNNSPAEAYNLLLAIIDISNLRLLRANREVTAHYEVSNAISHIQSFDLKAVVSLLKTFKSILEVDTIMYFEKNIVMEDYYKLKYDSGTTQNFQNQIFKFTKNTLSNSTIRDEGLELPKYTRSTPLFLWSENYGFLLIGRKGKDFHENEEKLLQNTATSFVGVIHQKEILENERNKSYMKSI